MRLICRAILAPMVIGSAAYYLASWFDFAYKPFLVLCGVIVGWPIKFILGIRYDGWHRTRRARAFGAVTPSEPRWKSSSHINIMGEIKEINENGFIGEFIFLGRG